MINPIHDIELDGTPLSDQEEKMRQALLRPYRVRIKVGGRDQTTLPVLAFNAADAICTLLHHMQHDEDLMGQMMIVAEPCHA